MTRFEYLKSLNVSDMAKFLYQEGDYESIIDDVCRTCRHKCSKLSDCPYDELDMYKIWLNREYR